MKYSFLFRGAIISGLFLVCVSFAQAAENGGVQLGGTRLIFDGKKEAASITVTNASEKDIWLMRFWVSPYGENTNSASEKQVELPFAVTPPLHRLDPKAAVQVRVNKINASLPTDREAVYYFNSLAIPPKKGEKNGQKAIQSGMHFAVNTRIKLLWRPVAISDTAEVKNAPRRLTLSASGKNLIIKNPTPYYITMSQLAINSKPVEFKGDTMIAPFNELSIPTTSGHGTLSYCTIDDRGMITPTLEKSY